MCDLDEKLQGELEMAKPYEKEESAEVIQGLSDIKK